MDKKITLKVNEEEFLFVKKIQKAILNQEELSLKSGEKIIPIYYTFDPDKEGRVIDEDGIVYSVKEFKNE